MKMIYVILDTDHVHIIKHFYCLTTAFLAYCMKNGFKNHLLKLKNVKKR